MSKDLLSLLIVSATVALTPTPTLGAGPSPAPENPPADGPAATSAMRRGGGPAWCPGNSRRKGVVAVNDPLAAEVGANILAQGGNAIDAAVAMAFAMNVVEPLSSGIGGGGFMVVHLAQSGETLALDFREKAPAASEADMLAGRPFSEVSTSGVSVGVPGAVLGLATALEAWGTFTLAETLDPAIHLAETGVPVSAFVAENAASPRTALEPETSAIFRRPDGAPLEAGDLLVQPDLARTFELIAEQGPSVFYEGEIAEAIVDAQRRARYDGGEGRMTLDDLALYDVALRTPVIDDYRGFTVASMPSPSSGGLTVIQILKMLERFPMGDERRGFGFGEAKTLHVMIEGMRLAFADRAVWMGDDDFVPVPAAGLLADPYVAARSAMISETTRMATPAAGDPLPFDGPTPTSPLAPGDDEEGSTTHFSVVDAWGNVVSCTVTIEQLWGTGITVPGYGFLLNNELTDFNRQPAPAPGTNNVAPFKRPRSSIAPTLLFKRGEPFAALGSPGGATIINSVLQVTMNLLDHGMTLQQAVDAPRISITSSSGEVTVEPGFEQASLDGLAALGHRLTEGEIGAVNAVLIDLRNGKRYGAGDPRRGGAVGEACWQRRGRRCVAVHD
ncbi:gamma-glutamyltransferase [Sorangium sp. So ce542]|uniref:gamma-glutamyltransferase n=1 Tax=Sorangium sp. So ce542 TaxID=3133316 RepID=UPI003F5D57AB